MREKLAHLVAQAEAMNNNPIIPREAKLNMFALISLLDEMLTTIEKLQVEATL